MPSFSPGSQQARFGESEMTGIADLRASSKDLRQAVDLRDNP
jgi:hypothetical protein